MRVSKVWWGALVLARLWVEFVVTGVSGCRVLRHRRGDLVRGQHVHVRQHRLILLAIAAVVRPSRSNRSILVAIIVVGSRRVFIGREECLVIRSLGIFTRLLLLLYSQAISQRHP